MGVSQTEAQRGNLFPQSQRHLYPIDELGSPKVKAFDKIRKDSYLDDRLHWVTVGEV